MSLFSHLNHQLQQLAREAKRRNILARRIERLEVRIPAEEAQLQVLKQKWEKEKKDVDSLEKRSPKRLIQLLMGEFETTYDIEVEEEILAHEAWHAHLTFISQLQQELQQARFEHEQLGNVEELYTELLLEKKDQINFAHHDSEIRRQLQAHQRELEDLEDQWSDVHEVEAAAVLLKHQLPELQQKLQQASRSQRRNTLQECLLESMDISREISTKMEMILEELQELTIDQTESLSFDPTHWTDFAGRYFACLYPQNARGVHISQVATFFVHQGIRKAEAFVTDCAEAIEQLCGEMEAWDAKLHEAVTAKSKEIDTFLRDT
ncbi:MAG: hypothetical protein AAF206_09405 [Bacteroidota bacterium]